ncbi:MAG: xanthine dehydrogenase family protein molybdopterin-binding subunit [Clostridium sp.]|nr:xanthine dehydrogenase family protein molybdopterin-binding subunit [Clostridium sp.]
MFKNVGKRIPKYDNLGAVTGQLKYPIDYSMPGQLIAKVLRCPYPRAKINSIDTSEAEKVPGVYAVITVKDVPYNRFAMVPDNHVLAEEITHYRGQAVAAVAAIDQAAALEAIGKIKVDMEELPFVVDPREAMKPDAPKVFPESESNMHMFDGKSEVRRIIKGDVEKGFAEADKIVEGFYTTPSQEHAFIEPTSTLAYIDESGKLVLHSKAQGMYFIQNDLCNVFKLPLNKLKFIGGTIGGGFGGLNSVATDHIAGLLALKTGKPVKFTLTREEEMTTSTVRTPWMFKFKDGVKMDGTITAREIEVIHDCGSFTELGLYAVEKNANFIAGALNVANVSVTSRLVYTNKQPSGSMRGFGVNVGQYADQVQLNRDAEAIGMDPIEIRLRNAFREGDHSHTDNELVAVSMIETLQNVAEMAGEKLPEELLALKSK